MQTSSPTVREGPVRHPELWYDDGTIVIKAENTLFRVYRGQLVRRSEVLCKLLSSPELKPDEEVEGCPVVELFDSASDVEHLLRAMLSGPLVRCAMLRPWTR